MDFDIKDFEERPSIKTGFTKLDELSGGVQPGQLIVISGYPSVGKSTLALNFAVGAAKRGTYVAFFSLETTADDFGRRLAAQMSGIPMNEIRRGIDDEIRRGRFIEAANEMAKLPITFFDCCLNSVECIEQYAAPVFSDGADGLIIVDSLQLLDAYTGTYNDRKVAQELKAIARQMDVPLIVTSGITDLMRAWKLNDADPIDNLFDGLDGIAQVAEVIMILNPVESAKLADGYQAPSIVNSNLVVAKNRNGRDGLIQMGFSNKTCQVFEL